MHVESDVKTFAKVQLNIGCLDLNVNQFAKLHAWPLEVGAYCNTELYLKKEIVAKA